MNSSPLMSTEDLLDAAERCLTDGSRDLSGARRELARLADAAAEISEGEVASLTALLADLMLIAESLPSGGPADAETPEDPGPFCRSAFSVIRKGLERQPEALEQLASLSRRGEEEWGEYLALLGPEERCRPLPEEDWPTQSQGDWPVPVEDSTADDDFAFDGASAGEIDMDLILSALDQRESHRQPGCHGSMSRAEPTGTEQASACRGSSRGWWGASAPAPQAPWSGSSQQTARGGPLPVPPQPDRNALDRELLPCFLDDAEQCLAGMEQSVLEIEADAEEVESLRQFSRELHTLKGASGTIGLSELAGYLHHLEDRVEAMTVPVTAADVELLLTGVDVVRAQLAALGSDPTFTPDPDRTVQQPARTARPSPPPPSPTAEAEGENLVRIEASRLDRLMDLLAELVMLRNRRDTYLSQLKELQHELNGCTKRIRTCGSQGADSLTPDAAHRLSQSLTETADELAARSRMFRDLCEPLETDNAAVSRLVGEFRRELTELRRLPLTGLFRRLRRAAREAARIEGKQVELEFRGQGTRAERLLQDRLYEPLMHVVRNAVSHGIESQEERSFAKKPPAGRILIEAHSTTAALFIDVSDDGRGLNEEALEQRGRELGLLSPGEAVSSEQLGKLIFHPGFSTRRQINELAGRGVGMDAVASRIRQMRGRIDVHSVSGQGTTFRLQIPLRSPIEHALVVRVGGQLFAFPMQSIYGAGEGAMGQDVEGMKPAEENRSAPNGKTLSPPRQTGSVDLGQFLGFRETAAPHPQLITLRHHAVGGGDAPPAGTESDSCSGLPSAPKRIRQLSIAVDSVVGVEEVVLRSLPSMLQGHELFAGVTLSGDAETVLLFDVPRLLEELRNEDSG